MTDETLEKAVNYKQQINELKKFVRNCRSCWNILWLHNNNNNNKRFKLKTAYEYLSDEIEVTKELSERILKTIENYTHELETELEKM